MYAVVSYVEGVGHLLLRTTPKDVDVEDFSAKLSQFSTIGGRHAPRTS